MSNKQINEFNLLTSINGDESFILQSTAGVTLRTTFDNFNNFIQINSTAGFITESELEEILNNSTSGYITETELNDILNNSTAGYITETELNDILNNSTAGYVTETELNDILNNSTSGYVTETELEEILNNSTSGFVSEAELNDILNNSTSGIVAKAEIAKSGYSFSGAFAGKPLTNNYVWEANFGIDYDSDDVSNELYKVFSLDRDVHLAVDVPYWSDPTPGNPVDIGLFAGQNLPNNVDSLFEFDYDYNVEYGYVADTSGTAGTSFIDLNLTGFENSIGRIKLNDCVPGDQLRVRFDFNIIPQIANTTIEPALWYSNRDENDNITFTFPLTAQPIFYGTGTVGKTYLNRVDISAWITSTEDVNALTLPSIKSDNPVIIQPLGLLVTIIR